MGSASWCSLSEDKVLRPHPKVVQGIWHPGWEPRGWGWVCLVVDAGGGVSKLFGMLYRQILPNPKGQG